MSKEIKTIKCSRLNGEYYEGYKEPVARSDVEVFVKFVELRPTEIMCDYYSEKTKKCEVYKDKKDCIYKDWKPL